MNTKLLIRLLSVLLVFACIMLGIEFTKTVFLTLAPSFYPRGICYLNDKITEKLTVFSSELRNLWAFKQYQDCIKK